jgi:hypothetical protein
MRAGRIVGLDPMAEWFRGKGIQYEGLGYTAVGVGRMEDAGFGLSAMGVDPAAANIILCCNVLDHTADLPAAVRGLAALGRIGSEIFLGYDLRTVPTALHPTTISADLIPYLLTTDHWVRQEFINLPPAPWHVNESAAVRVEHYRKEIS